MISTMSPVSNTTDTLITPQRISLVQNSPLNLRFLCPTSSYSSVLEDFTDSSNTTCAKKNSETLPLKVIPSSSSQLLKPETSCSSLMPPFHLLLHHIQIHPFLSIFTTTIPSPPPPGEARWSPCSHCGLLQFSLHKAAIGWHKNLKLSSDSA